MITGACANENGGCSDSCLSPDGVNVECHCPSGKILSEDRKTCTSQLSIHYELFFFELRNEELIAGNS